MTPAEPRRAATVLILRESDGELEVLLVKRGRGAPFMADAFVFPGGRVDEADGPAEDGDGASRRCAIRELSEEVGLSLAGPAGLCLFSHWITPSVEPRRFDTIFYLAALPGGQTPALDEKELSDLLWLSPGEAIERFAAGELKLPPPTLCNLEDLLGERAAAGAGPDLLSRVLLGCRGRQPVPILPKLVPRDEGLAVVMPWDPSFPELPGEGQPQTRPRHLRTRVCLLSSAGWRSQE